MLDNNIRVFVISRNILKKIFNASSPPALAPTAIILEVATCEAESTALFTEWFRVILCCRISPGNSRTLKFSVQK